MKKTYKIIILLILTILLVYISNITNIPNSILLFKGESLNLKTAIGINLNEKENYKTIQVSANTNNNAIDTRIVEVNFLNLFKVKEIRVNEMPEVEVIPLGNAIGIKLYTNGVLIIGMTEIDGIKPYKNTGLKEGDLITLVNEKKVESTSDLIQCVNESNGNKIELTYFRNGNIYTANIEPVKTAKNEYKIGLWVRDGAVGVGTITYYEPESKDFAALGHPIVDMDTGDIINIKNGEIVETSIISVKKGEVGTPGEIKGILKNEDTLGTINQNSEFGIFGTLQKTTNLSIPYENKMKVALRDEIKLGNAKVLLTLEDGVRREYDIKIKKIYKNNNENNKSMLIEIVDDELKEKTGGIVQGMSGAPIVQNGKFIRGNNACACK